MIRTKRTKRSRGTAIEEIIGVIFYNGTKEIAFIECITKVGYYRRIKPEDLIPQNLVQKEIKKHLTSKK